MPSPRRGTRWRVLTLSSLLVGLSLPLNSLSAHASEVRTIVAGVSTLNRQDVVVHQVITSSFDVALTQRHPKELTRFIASLTNTASANYHHFLTPSTYAARFGAAAKNVAAVATYLQSFGLKIGTLSRGRNLLHVSGTTVEIARALDAPVETVRVHGGQLVAHLTSPATLPHSLARDVVSIAGLSTVQPETTNTVLPHTSAAPRTCASAGSSSGTTPNSLGGYTVQQQAQLYGLSSAWAKGITGVGQTIGVYELGTYDSGDVATYFACFGLTPKVSSVTVDGGAGASFSDEATLDVEEAGVLAPGAKIVVYQGPNTNTGPLDTYSQVASNDTVTVLSTSWGLCEGDSTGDPSAEQLVFQEMAAQGQTVVSAAGDSGSSDCSQLGNNQPAVDDPSSQPYVTGVGGLNVSNINPLVQSVWNDQCTQPSCGAGGGGMSSLWSRPSWQVGDGINTTTQTMRMVPDLSVMADPNTGFIQYYTGSSSPGPCVGSCTAGWGSIGGTSIGSPLVSALVATAAQACGVSRLGFINPSLYVMASTGFVDVTSGNNDLFGVGVYGAGPGYDMASGLGSPNGTAFLTGLCPASFSLAQSSFTLSSTVANTFGTGPTISALLKTSSGIPVANASLGVSVRAPGGELQVDNFPSSTQGPGSANLQITSDASGALSFNVSSSIAQRVVVSLTYQAQTIYSTTLTFHSSLSVPGAPSIARVTSLVGGFSMTLRPPAVTGGLAIMSYQYSLNAGASWTLLAHGAHSLTVTDLKRGAPYNVIVRALNAKGPSQPSKTRRVVTRL